MKACFSRSTSLAENKSETSHMYIYNKVKVLQNHETVTLFENTKPNTRKLEAGLEYSEFEFELHG